MVTRNGKHNPNAPPRPKPHTRAADVQLPFKPRPVDDCHIWIICFDGDPPPIEERLNERSMWTRVNSINKEAFWFEAVSVSWSGRGEGPSIMIKFSGDTKEADIESQAPKSGNA
jgi:hypothetical protein